MGQVIAKVAVGAVLHGWEPIAYSGIQHVPGLGKPSVAAVMQTITPACTTYGGPFAIVSPKNTMIVWIVLQVAVVPIAMFVIMLGCAPDMLPGLSGKVVPEGEGKDMVIKDCVAVKVDGTVQYRRRKAGLRAALATIFATALAAMVAVEGFAIGGSRFCGGKENSGNPNAPWWAMPYGLFGLVTCGCLLAAVISVVMCWRNYARVRRELRERAARVEEGVEMQDRCEQA
jgi:hypothetical protein